MSDIAPCDARLGAAPGHTARVEVDYRVDSVYESAPPDGQFDIVCCRVETGVRAFLAGLRDEDLDRVVEFALGGGPQHSMRLGELVHHAAIHGVHHRGQIALPLRQLGQVPGNFDILFYYGRPK